MHRGYQSIHAVELGLFRFFGCYVTGRGDTFHMITTRENAPFDMWSQRNLWSAFAWRNFVLLAIHNAPSEDSDQTARMIWIFAGRICPNVPRYIFWRVQRFLTSRLFFFFFFFFCGAISFFFSFKFRDYNFKGDNSVNIVICQEGRVVAGRSAVFSIDTNNSPFKSRAYFLDS